jgi:hypothetical protein|nr:MAG TPA: hypothetical protein [Caudoviricetes sp.]
MKKLIKLEFNNTTRERKTEDSYSELYSHDKNNGSFEFEILNETLTTEQVTALFKFTESNKIWKTTGTVEGNKVKVTFDTTLITQNETVICYLYFDEEQRTSDTFRFKFKVKVSEIDKMSRYEVKERFINNTVIVDRLDVVTKDELKEALKNVGGIATEGLLTEVKAEELFVKKTDAVDNTNFELVKNRVLALELKTDKDTVYDDSEVKERLTTLENKAPVDLSNYATKQELANVSGSQPLADNLVTKEELENRHYISDVSNLATKDELNEVRNSQPTVDTSHLVTRDELEGKGYLTEHQDLTPYALKSEIPQPYNDTPLNERITALENKPTTGGSVDTSNLATKEELAKAVTKEELETKHYVTEEELNNKAYLTTHQSLDNVVTKEELATKGYISDVSNLVTKEELESKNYLTTPYNDTPLKERVEVLENKVDKDTIYNDTELRNRVEVLENKPNVDLSSYVTNDQLENKGFIKQHQELTHLATTSDLEVLRNIAASKADLSKKVDTTDFNTFKDNVVTKTELAEKGYLTTHQDLSEYALKSELYNDSNLQFRFNSLDYDVRNSVDSLKKSVGDFEYKLRDYDDKISNLDSTISYSATKNELYDYVKRTELPAPYDDTELRNSLHSVENELRNKENEFNSRFVSKDDLRTLVTEIVSQLKSENN